MFKHKKICTIQFIKLIHVEDRILPLFIVQMQRHKGFFLYSNWICHRNSNFKMWPALVINGQMLQLMFWMIEDLTMAKVKIQYFVELAKTSALLEKIPTWNLVQILNHFIDFFPDLLSTEFCRMLGSKFDLVFRD